MRVTGALAAAVVLGVLPPPARAQVAAPASPPASQPAGGSTPAASTGSPRDRIGRWFELQNATLNLRYRVIDTSAGNIATNQVQHRETIRARIKLDASARYTWNFGVFTGTRFTSGWDNTGWGISGAQKNFAFKASYLSAIPFQGIEAQYGGLYIVRGQSTEITTYDEDGYLVGQRVSIKRPRELYLDELSATVGYLTPDPDEIPISRRTRYLNDVPNYRQFLADKKVGTRAGISVDFTHAQGANTWRQGFNLRTPELIVADTIVFELYERINRTPEQGFALTIDKAVRRNVSFNLGYASIDPAFGGLNSDRFHIGNRVFAMGTYTISPEFVASAFITRALGNDVPLPQRTLMNLVVTYNALPALRRTGLFR